MWIWIYFDHRSIVCVYIYMCVKKIYRILELMNVFIFVVSKKIMYIIVFGCCCFFLSEFTLKVKFCHGLEEFLLSLLSSELQNLLRVAGVELRLSDSFDLFESISVEYQFNLCST